MQIDATNADNESWRISRLNKALKNFITILDVTDTQADFMIDSLIDHKGELKVYWRTDPTESQKRAIVAAWGMVGESNVHHKTKPSEYSINNFII